MLAGALLLAGFGNALRQPAGNALVASHVAERRFGIGFAIKQSAIPLATTVAGLAVPLIALTVGWRWAYAASGVVAAAASVHRAARCTGGARSVRVGGPLGCGAAVWMLALGMTSAVVAASSIGSLGAAEAVAAGLSPAAAGLLIAAGGVAELAVRLAAGASADRWHFDSLHAVALLTAVGAVGWLLMAVGAGRPVMPESSWSGLVVGQCVRLGLARTAASRGCPALSTATAAASGVTMTGVVVGAGGGSDALGQRHLDGRVGWAWATAALAALIGSAAACRASGRLPHQPPSAEAAARSTARVGHSGIPAAKSMSRCTTDSCSASVSHPRRR